jgi:hypothetical protein
MPTRRQAWDRNRRNGRILAWNSAFEPKSPTGRPVIALTDQESGWVDELAGRLRVIQADAVTAAPEERREYLKEEVARHFKAALPAHRKRLLQALLERFPVAGQVLKPAPPAPAPSPAPAPLPETVDETLERLLAAVKGLPAEKRAGISKRLAAAGLAPAGRGALVVEISDKLREGLGLEAGQPPPLTRLAELTVFLLEALCLLDQTALKTMRELSPRSPLLKRPEDFRKAAARFLVRDDETLEPAWAAMRGLLGALLAAIQGGLKTFGRQYVDRFSPSGIEAVVMGEGGGPILGIGKTRKERCWEKYTRLSEDYDTPDLVDRRVKDCLAVFVENLLRSGH